MNEQSEQGERMSREIPRAVKDQAFRLWLQGHSYREIRDRTGMSLGGINQVITDFRRGSPNLDQLRQLNLLLSRGGSNAYDAMRGGQLLDKVGQLGVSLDQLEGYIKLAERISSERGVEAERFVESAVKLMKLEVETGKTYGGVLKDLEEKLSETAKLEGKIDALKGNIQKFTDARVRLEGELTKAKGNLMHMVQELKRTVSAKERLEKLGLERLNAIAEFTEDFEGLGFDAQEVQKLAKWRKSLKTIRIDPDELESFIKRKGTFEKQLQEVEAELTEGRARLKILSKLERDLQRRVDDILRIERILQSRVSSFACPHCGGVTLREVRRFEVQMALSSAQPLTIVCQRCLVLNQYDPRTLLLNLGLEILS